MAMKLSEYSDSIDEGYISIRSRGEGRYRTNQQPSFTITGDSTWAVSWTQATREAHPDQRVVCARSTDQGKTWSEEIVIEDADPEGRNASWAMLFAVPTSNRLYAFYWWNENANKQRDGGRIYFRFSEDAGRTWSGRYATPMARHSIDEPGHDSHGWNTGFPMVTRRGEMLLGFSKISPRTPPNTNPDRWHTECFFLIGRNILTETDPEKLDFVVTPEKGQGLWAPHPDTSAPFGQEPYMAQMPNGNIICTFRTRTGHPYYSISRDHGYTWMPGAALRQCPGGPKLLHPCGPCQILSLSDGRIAFIYNNRVAGEGMRGFWGTYWCPRWPSSVIIGRQAPEMAASLPEAERNGGLVFTAPRIFLREAPATEDDFSAEEKNNGCAVRAALYPHTFEWCERYFILYADSKLDLRLKEIPAEFFSDYGLPR